MNISFSVSETEHKQIRALILIAYQNLSSDLDNKKLSEISAYALSREFDTLAKLKRKFTDE
tara:strand:+ start:1137 stop:1319 length:183 start_codon:yes stop_codon:yes gene_type:complete